ncbi:hypothetical protein DICVIV_10349 [Dictyocaulus viviparus]|uniref:GPR180/TMEM145 transmembrane domain-containing protein n=1 Tax=Dictyocaulus viviparus TaxID=29172 RepID=A0A0D8XML9_DICVI|nr:hypothetical protein DICVIV_10349 [Dictyocaulus viviparus]
MNRTEWFLFLVFSPELLVVMEAVHVEGVWNTATERVKFVTKFGFQQTNALDRENSRGFVFGNVTSKNDGNPIERFLLTLVPHSLIGSFRSNSQYTLSCGAIMKNISKLGFDSRCLTDGSRGDIFRSVPCSKDRLCREEDDPRVVVPGCQLTMQVEEPVTAEYWLVDFNIILYLVLVNCKLDKYCNWTQSKSNVLVEYDIWLTNGRPGSFAANPLTWQFSFDEQNTLEIYVITLLVYIVLSAVMARGIQLTKRASPPARLKLLNFIITMKTAGVALQSLNVFVFAFDGQGLIFARVLGEVLRIISIEFLCLLLLLISQGWGLYSWGAEPSRSCIISWAILAVVNITLFFYNLMFVYDVLHDINVFTSWPGYGQLVIRMCLALWFLIEIRRLIIREQFEDRASFVAHIGAGFLVWFVYQPGLGVVASFISQLWRFKIILGITSFANYIAIACLVHLFWPTSSYRKFFHDELNHHRRMHRTESHEMHDLEMLLFESENSDADFPEIDENNTLQSNYSV